MKLTDPQRLEVVTFCISYLFEKFPNERGLFRSSVSQTDVRNLQNQLALHSVKAREDLDPHLVAEVLQTTFRDLNSPLMSDIYKDMVAAELVDEDYEANKELVQSWLLKIPDSKYAIVNSLFRLLARVASFEDSESSLMQLTSSVTPTICRPLTSSYMSIRHMEDLKKLRPVIAFFIENYLDLFTVVRSSSIKLTTSESPTIELSAPSLDRSNSISETASMIVDSSTKEGIEESKSRSNSNDPVFPRPNLLVMIPSVNPNAMDTSHDSDTDSEKSVGSSYSDNEWRILMALVSMKVGNYLELPEKDLQQSVIKESTGDAHHSIMQSYAAKQAAAAQAKLDAVASSSSPNSTILAPILNSTPVLTKSHARRSHRRKMVSECKGLRAQIFEYEQDFFKSHNRAPKGQERGNMNPVYIKYRELKREIRDAAAKDIQRVIRGYRCRQRLKKAKSFNTDLKEGLSTANYELLVRFRDLLELKKDLKKRLKKFDEDFYVQYGRAPKKSDKEVIRPMYQKYHEIKGNIDSMRKLLVANNIPLPEDVDDNLSRSNCGAQSKSPSTTNLDTDTDNESKGRPLANFGSANYATSDDEGGESSGRGKSSSSDMKEDSNLSALLQEKKNLHAYLKVYERDFNRIHGRPVMKNEDILPVANEYQRYKELKTIIKDIKA